MKYRVATKKNGVFMNKDQVKDIMINITAAVTAWLILREPDGKGLLDFLGCFLSFSISKTSFSKYMLPESRQNIIKAEITVIHRLIFNKFNEKAIPMNITRFLYHCLGRMEMKISFNILNTILVV